MSCNHIRQPAIATFGSDPGVRVTVCPICNPPFNRKQRRHRAAMLRRAERQKQRGVSIS
jgi:hypothetical protein